jgi:hypothetical protein
MLYKNLSWQDIIWKMPVRMILDAVAAWKHLLSGDAGFFIAVANAHIHFIQWVFFGRNNNPVNGYKRARFPGWYHGSIVWDHFIKKKKTFLEIVDNK